MFDKLRPRSVYDVMAAIACFGVLAGGSAYAAATITGADVVDESLTGADVKGKQGTSSTPAVNGTLGTQDLVGQQANPANGTPFIDGSLTQWDIKNSSLTGDDVADNSLTSADVVESSLAKVPNADKLDGVDSSQFQQVGLVQAGGADESETEGFAYVIRWDQLAQITTDGDADQDHTVRILNTGSQDVHVTHPNGGQSSFAPGQATSVDVEGPGVGEGGLGSILIWSADGARSWLVACVDDLVSTQIRCHGVANRLG